jgi:hypothetical protein
MELALLVAWLVIHAAYRGGVGTYCAVKKIEPPWVKNKTERLVNREIRQGRRYEALRSKRTLRGFFGRLWGDLWEDANRAQDERRAWRLNGAPRRSWRDRANQWRDATQPGMRTRLAGVWLQEWWQRARQWGERLMSASLPHRKDTDGEELPEAPDLEPVAAPEVPEPQQEPTPQDNPPPPPPPPAAEPEPAPQPPPAVVEPSPTGRPQLRAVPNPPTQPVTPPAGTDTQGEQPDMTAPAEITNVQRVRQFAEQVEKHGNEDWPAKLDTAEQQITAIGLNNDPAVTAALGEIREAVARVAAGGVALAAALPRHEDAAERITGLGDAAATNITAYQNQ